MSDQATSEPGCMDGGEHSLRAEFVGGPVDGVRGMVCMGLDKILQVIRGVVHIYEFDPVTTEDGEAWIYRYRGAEAWVRKAEEVDSVQCSVFREEDEGKEEPS